MYTVGHIGQMSTPATQKRKKGASSTSSVSSTEEELVDYKRAKQLLSISSSGGDDSFIEDIEVANMAGKTTPELGPQNVPVDLLKSLKDELVAIVQQTFGLSSKV